MENISVREAAEKWGISVRRVQTLCSNGRINGAVRFGRSWMIPADAQKPDDPRRERDMSREALNVEFSSFIEKIGEPMPRDNPDSILDTVNDERERRQFVAQLAYLRGDFQKVLSCFRKAEGDFIARSCIAPFAIAAAASLGDFDTCTEISKPYKLHDVGSTRDVISYFEELNFATIAMSATAPSMMPDWIKAGDFSNLPGILQIEAFQIRARYLLAIGRTEAALAVAETALAIYSGDRGIRYFTIGLLLACATSCYVLDRTEECRRWLMETLHICLPHGFVTPIAEMLLNFGGIAEKCILQIYPESYDAVIGQCKRTIKNWIFFHNYFTKENITDILTIREYHIAQLVAQRIPYAEIASRQGVSVSSIKKTVQNIYAKLFVSNRTELAKLVLLGKS